MGHASLGVGLIPPSERPGPDRDGVWGLLAPWRLCVLLLMPSLQALCSFRCITTKLLLLRDHVLIPSLLGRGLPFSVLRYTDGGVLLSI